MPLALQMPAPSHLNRGQYTLPVHNFQTRSSDLYVVTGWIRPTGLIAAQL